MDNMIPVSKPPTFGTAHLGKMFSFIMEDAIFTNNGRRVRMLEKELASRLKVPHFVAMSNGTAALEAALSLLFKPGSVIAVPSFTFVAVATAVVRCGCEPLFIDITPDTWTISYDDYDDHAGIVDGVIVANSFGVMPDRRFLVVDAPMIYDNAQGFGMHLGMFGDLDVYSLHATKIVNSAEGGGIACDEEHLGHLTEWRNFGFDGTGGISCVGTNAKMSEFHAVLASASLGHEGWQVAERARLLDMYKSRLRNVVQFQVGASLNCVVLTGKRDNVMCELAINGYDSRPYFFPIHKMLPFRQDDVVLPVTDYVAESSLALPLWAGMKDETVRHICDIVKGEL